LAVKRTKLLDFDLKKYRYIDYITIYFFIVFFKMIHLFLPCNLTETTENDSIGKQLPV